MILGVVVSQVSDDAVNQKIEEAFESDESFNDKMEEEKAAIEKLKNEINEIRSNPAKKIDPKKKDKLREQIASLEKKKKLISAQNKKQSEIAADLKKAEAKMSEEMAKLTKELAQAEDEWEKMEDPSKLVKMVVKQSGSGAGGDLEPTFIECRSEGIRVYKGKNVDFEVKTGIIAKDPKFQNLVRALAKEAPYRTWVSAQGTSMDARYVKREGPIIYLRNKKGVEMKVPSLQLSKASQQIAAKYEIARKAKRPDPEARFIIFLIRSKGFSSWTRAVQVCAKFNCRYGQLPLDGEGEIDLSLFAGS
jgi:uncharacterized phage infection (PIP) family protein YhgE